VPVVWCGSQAAESERRRRVAEARAAQATEQLNDEKRAKGLPFRYNTTFDTPVGRLVLTVEIRYLGMRDVYETQSFRCQNSGTRLDCPSATTPPSTPRLLMHSFCMQHQVIRYASFHRPP
jgi:hypothetical protein